MKLSKRKHHRNLSSHRVINDRMHTINTERKKSHHFNRRREEKVHMRHTKDELLSEESKKEVAEKN